MSPQEKLLVTVSATDGDSSVNNNITYGLVDDSQCNKSWCKLFFKALFNSGPQCFNLMGNELYVKANAAISEAALRKRLISITVKVGNKKRY